MNIVNLGLSHVMPWGIRDLLLSKTIQTNVTQEKRVKVYEAIENFLGRELSKNLPAVLCQSILLSVLNDKSAFKSTVNLHATSALSSMAFVLSDAILCCMNSSGWKTHPLYDKIMSELVNINQKMAEGTKIFEKRYWRQTQSFFEKRRCGTRRKGDRRKKQRRRRRGGSVAFVKQNVLRVTTPTTSTGAREEYVITICEKGDACKACNFLFDKIGCQDNITMKALTELVGDITDLAFQL